MVAALGREDVAAGAPAVSLGLLGAVAVPDGAVSPLGALLSSSAKMRISRPSTALPLLAVTFCVTFVLVILTSLPTGAFLIPLSIKV